MLFKFKMGSYDDLAAAKYESLEGTFLASRFTKDWSPIKTEEWLIYWKGNIRAWYYFVFS
tara:strand:+ start:162 stop:341 length:180 start_codon:yes stop_codon:yes gene_type:complete